jgi:hypothetical protein
MCTLLSLPIGVLVNLIVLQHFSYRDLGRFDIACSNHEIRAYIQSQSASLRRVAAYGVAVDGPHSTVSDSTCVHGALFDILYWSSTGASLILIDKKATIDWFIRHNIQISHCKLACIIDDSKVAAFARMTGGSLVELHISTIRCGLLCLTSASETAVSTMLVWSPSLRHLIVGRGRMTLSLRRCIAMYGQGLKTLACELPLATAEIRAIQCRKLNRSCKDAELNKPSTVKSLRHHTRG